jgi:hypothetical protein
MDYLLRKKGTGQQNKDRRIEEKKTLGHTHDLSDTKLCTRIAPGTIVALLAPKLLRWHQICSTKKQL